MLAEIIAAISRFWQTAALLWKALKLQQTELAVEQLHRRVIKEVIRPISTREEWALVREQLFDGRYNADLPEVDMIVRMATSW